MKKVFGKLLLILWAIVSFSLIALPLHEFGHWVGGQIVGVDKSWIEYPTFPGGFYHYEGDLTGFETGVVMISGGLFVFLAFLCFYWLPARWTPTRWDLDDEIAVAVVGVNQLGYGVCEMFWQGYDMPAALIVPYSGFVALAVFFFYWESLKRWLRQ